MGEKREGQTDQPVSSRNPSFWSSARVLFLWNSGGALVSPEVIDHNVDRIGLVERRGKERGRGKLLG